jgi:enoyl-CoA hydratase/carnithine racemase
MGEHVATDAKDGVFTLKFNRPDKKNALTTAMYADAAAALRAAAADASVRVVVITGSGDSFTAGNDLKDFLENPPTSPDAPVFQFMTALSVFAKPVIAAVNGVAVGIGTTLLLHCDLAYAAAGAKFQLPFVNLAIVPEFASSLLLPRTLGRVRAAELLLLGEPFTSEKALELGLINAVVPPSDLVQTVRMKAAALAAKPPAALRQAKALLRGDGEEISARIGAENRIVGERLISGEFKEAATAFFEKRQPDFSKFS